MKKITKKLVIAAGFLVVATSTSWAQVYVYGSHYGYAYGPYYSYDYGPGVYDYAPGYGGFYGGNWEWDRSSGPGRGMSAESQR
jgi:hypothetical protein